MSERVIVLAQDLIWADRLARAATAAGGTVTRAGSIDALAERLDAADGAAAAGASFVIVDLTAHAYDPLAAIGVARTAGARILAVGQHDDVDQRKRALAAGADRVLAYRKLFEDGPATIAAWFASRPSRSGVPA